MHTYMGRPPSRVIGLADAERSELRYDPHATRVRVAPSIVLLSLPS